MSEQQDYSSSSAQDSPTRVSPVEADAPFNSDTADCILRSADGVDFRLHTLILSMASSVFESMFTLPKPPSESPGGEKQKDQLPVIPVSEESSLLDLLLRLIYPTSAVSTVDQIASEPLSTIISLYETADKYAMLSLISFFREHLIEHAPRNPIVAYAFGCRHQLSWLVDAAATASLETDIDDLPYSPQLELITASDLYRLQLYHRQCQQVADPVPISEWSPSDVPAASSSNPMQGVFGPRKAVARVSSDLASTPYVPKARASPASPTFDLHVPKARPVPVPPTSTKRVPVVANSRKLGLASRGSKNVHQTYPIAQGFSTVQDIVKARATSKANCWYEYL